MTALPRTLDHRPDCDERCNGDWCECLCHQDTTPISGEYGVVYPCPSCGNDSGGPEGATCGACWNDAIAWTQP